MAHFLTPETRAVRSATGLQQRLRVAIVVVLVTATALTGLGFTGHAQNRGTAMLALNHASAASDARLEEIASAPFGVFDGVDYVQFTGRFVGSTSLGAFRVPFEIVVPADPDLGSGTVVFEPPHFTVGPGGRDLVLGQDLLFRQGDAWASVGFGTNGLNVLDPTAADAVIAGQPVVNPGELDLSGVVDEEILIQFAQLLRESDVLPGAPGGFERVYAFGVSQTSSVLLEMLFNPASGELFDFTMLHVASWQDPFWPAGVWDFLDGEFALPSGGGRMIFIETEGDLVISDPEQFRSAAERQDVRIYEVAGAAHVPTPTNPLDHYAVGRALWTRGDAWVRLGELPPPSMLIERDETGTPDPVYGFVTGIARDADLNARGGLRLPDLHVGRAQFIAADFSVAPLPGFEGLFGLMVDLACEPRPGSEGGPRFRNHGAYVSQFSRQTDRLVRQGFLLPADAEVLKEQAATSQVGKPRTCAT